MDTTKNTDAEYLAQAVPLLDEIEAGIKKATGLEGARREYSGTFFFEIKDFLSIIVDHELCNPGSYIRGKTGNPFIRVSIGGRKARFHKRSDGTYNVKKIMDDVVRAAAALKTRKDEFEQSEILRKENERLMNAELGVIEIPKGVVVHRDPMSGIYLITTNGGGAFLDLLASEVNEVLAMFKKYRFEGRGW